MAEIRGYTCDGGCGATTVVDKPTDQLSRQGWHHVFTAGGGQVYFCSNPCMARWANGQVPAPAIGPSR